MSNYHTSVLLQEAIDFLAIKPGEKYIDATLGGGGHMEQILKHGGRVLGIDTDKDALDHVKEKFKTGEALVLAKGNFRNIEKMAKVNGFENVAGILFDFGVSSFQLDNASRGFSFSKDGPLDMRMDESLGVKALDLLKVLTKKELCDIFTRLGEEKNAWRISVAIDRERTKKSIEGTLQLADIIEKAVGRKFGEIHPATRVFQALRIIVNDELGSIEEALPKAVKLLKKGGKIVAISFHSLEDRIVKQAFLQFEKEKLGKILTDKPVLPLEAEIQSNARSRSAKLRAFEKL